MDRRAHEHSQAVNRPAPGTSVPGTSVPGTKRDGFRWVPWDRLPCRASESAAAGQRHFTVFPASESHLLTSCAIISSDLSIWIADTGECRRPGPPGQGRELGASRTVNIPSQRLPTGGSVSESNGFCSFCFCSFCKGFHLTHDFPTSSFCSLRKQE